MFVAQKARQRRRQILAAVRGESAPSLAVPLAVPFVSHHSRSLFSSIWAQTRLGPGNSAWKFHKMQWRPFGRARALSEHRSPELGSGLLGRAICLSADCRVAQVDHYCVVQIFNLAPLH